MSSQSSFVLIVTRSATSVGPITLYRTQSGQPLTMDKREEQLEQDVQQWH